MLITVLCWPDGWPQGSLADNALIHEYVVRLAAEAKIWGQLTTALRLCRGRVCVDGSA